MSRWYSKQRKQRMTGDFITNKFIPSRGRITLAQKPGRFASHLSLCEYTEECDFCNKPGKNTPCYVRIVECGEAGSEADYCICKHCLRRKHHERMIGEESQWYGYSGFHQWKARAKMTSEQHVCDYCDEIVTGDCDCNGAAYWRAKESSRTGIGEGNAPSSH